jgi:NTE family protein
MVEDELSLSALGASSKLNTEHEFLDMLFAKGRQATEHWIGSHFDALGERSTVNIRDLFQGDEDALDGQRITRDARFRQTPAE